MLCAHLKVLEMELFTEPTDGMFVWARFPQVADLLALAEAAQREGMVIAPGSVFRPHLERSPWMRFDVAVCEDRRVHSWLQRLASSSPYNGNGRPSISLEVAPRSEP